jgi:hypothetical protein
VSGSSIRVRRIGPLLPAPAPRARFRAVTAESSDFLMHPMQSDRRPAIWPWLVMPLIALSAFYCLDRLSREARDQEDAAPAPAVHADAPAEPGAP